MVDREAIDRYALYIALAGFIASTIFSGLAIYQTGQIAQENVKLNEKAIALTEFALQIENATSNYQPYLLPYYVTASIPDLYSSMPLDNFGQVNIYGSLNLSVVAITPHASIINFTSKNITPEFLDSPFFVPNFNVTVNQNTDWMNASNIFEPRLTVMPYLPFEERGNNQFYDYKPQAFVEQGVTLVNFVIPIHASIPLNPEFQGQILGANLGSVAFEFDMYDVQLQKTVAVYSGSTAILTNVNLNYG